MGTNLKPLPGWLPLDERRAQRWPMDMPARLQTQMQAAKIGARVLDLSTGGCLLVVPGGMALGRYVTLTLPHSLAAEGWIAWSSGDHAGMDFAHAFPPALVDLLIREHTPS